MERLQQVVHRLDARVTSPDVVNDRKQRQSSAVWRALSLFDTLSHAPLFIALYVAWDAVCAYVVGLALGGALLNSVLVLGFACVQYAFQLALASAVKFLYLNYAWLAALAATLCALLQREFPAPQRDTAEPCSQAYQARVDAQWQRLRALTERYPARTRIALCNDLEDGEALADQNVTRLAALGYHLEPSGEPDWRNALLVGRHTTRCAPTEPYCVIV